MASVNKVILVGNVGKDPVIRDINQSGDKVANFSLATTDKYKTKDGKEVETTEWHNIVAWRGLCNVIEKYVKKGTPIYVEGRIKYSTYTDKDGSKKNKTEVVVDTIQLLSYKASNDSDSKIEREDISSTSYQEAAAPQPTEIDSLPF
jgi:single-strand DNA-binding protein